MRRESTMQGDGLKKLNLALIGAALLLVAACGGGSDTTTTVGGDGGATTTVGDDGGASTTTGGDGSTTTAGEATGDGVQAAESDLGTILVDPEGFTLYIFTMDAGGESTCYESCAATWPPVPGDTPIGADLDASLFGTTARTDGTEQLTVNGQPLYRYSPDANPGDTTGQGVGGVWFVVGTDGAMIEASAAGYGRADY
jgi:predicted lipoprotein with Yx(FWY)xxD motif